MSRKSIFRSRRSPVWRRVRIVAALLLLAWIAMAVWHSFKPLPEGLSAEMPLRPVHDVRFLADYSFTDASGRRRVEHRIFDRVLALVGQAERLIVMDMFLFNDFAGRADGPGARALSAEVTDALVRRMGEVEQLRVIVITDPINRLYGSYRPAHFQRLREAGAELVFTELRRLRASNPAWAGTWRICCQWFGRSDGGGWLPNPMGGREITLRGLLELLNFKANHRKTLVVDRGEGWAGLVTSGNPHDASSAHSNIGVEFSGPAVRDLLATEAAVAAFSAPALEWPTTGPTSGPTMGAAGDRRDSRIQVLTESAIRDAVLELLRRSGDGDAVDLAMFYLAHREIIGELVAARRRGATVRVLLDPNEDAFGRKKNGVPNRSVAAELVDADINVRWCDTTGEQCHDKIVIARRADGAGQLIAGSANFTRRNLDDFNLETGVRVAAPSDAAIMTDAAAYFDRRWYNRPGEIYSVAYSEFVDEGWFRYWQYRFMEFTGLSTF